MEQRPIFFELIKENKIGFGKYKNKTYGEIISNSKPEYFKYIDWIIKQRDKSEKNDLILKSPEVGLLIKEYEKIIENQAEENENDIDIDEVLNSFEHVVTLCLSKGYKKTEQFMTELKKILNQ